jgi:hypothetical protein
MKYRKLPGTLYKWHNHPACPEWPLAGYVRHDDTPEETEICPICAMISKFQSETPKPDPNKK